VFFNNDIWFIFTGNLFFKKISIISCFFTLSVLVRLLNRARSWWRGIILDEDGVLNIEWVRVLDPIPYSIPYLVSGIVK